MIDSQRLTRWYDVQAPFYRWWRNDYDHPIVGRVVAALAERGPRHALLDAGCGTGLFAIGLVRAFPGARVDGLDASAGMLRVACREATRRVGRGGRVARPAFVQGDVRALPYGAERFDGAVLAGVLPGVDDRWRVLAELRRVLAPAGRLVVVEFDRQAMRARTRAFVRALIAGYRVVSFVLPRYRFASSWSLARSTVDRIALEGQAQDAGFRILRVDAAHEHLLFVLERG